MLSLSICNYFNEGFLQANSIIASMKIKYYKSKHCIRKLIRATKMSEMAFYNGKDYPKFKPIKSIMAIKIH